MAARKRKETQQSVASWADRNFPGATLADGLRHLFEEATELAAVTDVLDLDALLDVVRKSWKKSQKDRGDHSQIGGEIADIRIATIWMASACDVDEQRALDEKMARNRRKTPAEMRMRLRRKDNIYRPES